MLTYYNNYVPLVQLKTINMPRQARKTSGTGIYHVMLRGINRQNRSENRPRIYGSTLLPLLAINSFSHLSTKQTYE